MDKQVKVYLPHHKPFLDITTQHIKVSQSNMQAVAVFALKEFCFDLTIFIINKVKGGYFLQNVFFPLEKEK